MRPRAMVAMLALLAGVTAVQAQPALQCSGAQKPWVVAELLFGRGRVSEANWSQFLSAEVTPRFPEGLTVLDGYGQWRSPAGSTSRERSKVVMIAMAPSVENDSRLQQIIEAYKTRFKQQSVGLIVRPACVSF